LIQWRLEYRRWWLVRNLGQSKDTVSLHVPETINSISIPSFPAQTATTILRSAHTRWPGRWVPAAPSRRPRCAPRTRRPSWWQSGAPGRRSSGSSAPAHRTKDLGGGGEPTRGNLKCGGLWVERLRTDYQSRKASNALSSSVVFMKTASRRECQSQAFSWIKRKMRRTRPPISFGRAHFCVPPPPSREPHPGRHPATERVWGDQGSMGSPSGDALRVPRWCPQQFLRPYTQEVVAADPAPGALFGPP